MIFASFRVLRLIFENQQQVFKNPGDNEVKNCGGYKKKSHLQPCVKYFGTLQSFSTGFIRHK